jgi:hypothetical protein
MSGNIWECKQNRGDEAMLIRKSCDKHLYYMVVGKYEILI